MLSSSFHPPLFILHPLCISPLCCRNSDYLDSLGLENVKPSQPYKKPKKRQSVNKRKNEMSTAAQPMRRSTRHISVDNYQPDSVIPETSSHENKIKNAKQVEVEEFEDSDVLTYLIDDETKVTDNSDIKNSQSVNDQSRLKDKACHRLERLKYSDWNSFNLGVKTRWYSIHSDKRYAIYTHLNSHICYLTPPFILTYDCQ